MSAREQFDDPRMERLQLRLLELERLVSSCPFVRGRLVKGVALTTASSNVAHGLGRTPNGFVALSVTPDAAIGLSATQTIDTSRLVAMEASATCTADIWFW